ncbi:hypothetical protein N7472_000923 [Penicillium cf. griseofulvum]|uniref:Uncharacterized protein n=1 Tax=Penicillium cf. griseofulvum TaxID=2972120 RepID=A0A9W9T602_9EURO|nr:hypothetical protein N7472_000923 [Penicillium cf. griseofulvum]
MRYLNNLPADAIEGTIDGITIRWSNNGNFNLPGNASKFKIDPGDMKRATEHVAHACAKRLGKTEVRLYLFVWLGIRIGTTGENAYLPRWLHDLVVRFQPSSTFLRDATMTAHPPGASANAIADKKRRKIKDDETAKDDKPSKSPTPTAVKAVGGSKES